MWTELRRRFFALRRWVLVDERFVLSTYTVYDISELANCTKLSMIVQLLTDRMFIDWDEVSVYIFALGLQSKNMTQLGPMFVKYI